jgi:hypothetical protein
VSARLTRTLGILGAVGPGPTWKVICPVHGDSSPSLHVKRVPGKLLLRCRVGCATVDVLAAKGLRWSDLFAEDAR